MKKLITFLSAVATVAILSGCGGGGILDDTPPSGTLDENFGGGDGYRVYDTAGIQENRVSDIDIDSNNNVYIAGQVNEAGHNKAFITKFDNDGNIVNSFGTNGMVKKEVYAGKSSVATGIKNSNSKLYFTMFGLENSTKNAGAVGCIDASSGDACAGWPTGGIRKFNMLNKNDLLNDLVVSGDYIYTVGSYETTSGYKGRMYKLNKNSGSWLDGSISNISHVAYNSLVLANSNLYIAGDYANMITNSMLTKYKLDFNLDTSFNTVGYALKDIAGSGNYDEAKKLVVDSNGNSYVVGFYMTGTSEKINLYVAKFKNNGSLDTSFANNGVFRFDGGNNANDFGVDIVFDNSGNLIVAGTTSNGTDEDVLVLKLNTDGELIEDFADNGVLTDDLDGGRQLVGAVAIDNNGKIVVAGKNRDAGADDIFIMKINP